MLDNLMDSFISLSLVDTLSRAWMAVCDHVIEKGDEHRDVLIEVSRALWRLTAVATIHAIWCARLRLRHEPDALQSTLQAVVDASIDNALRDVVCLAYELEQDV